MSPEERQLLQGLFDRMRSNAGTPRDAEAEKMIADGVQQQPYAPYLLAQTVIVQDQALQAANQRLQQMEEELQHARSSSQSSGSSGGFLSSIFGGGQRQEPPPPSQSVWNRGSGAPGGYAPQGYPSGGYPQAGYPQGGYAPPPPPQGGPWGGGGMSSGGGGFLQGALGTAAGVAGGVLLADSIKGLFSGGHGANAFGIANGVPGIDSSTIMGPEVVNNYYGDSGGRTAADWQSDAAQDAADYGDGSDRTAADWQQDADQDLDDMQDDDDFA